MNNAKTARSDSKLRGFAAVRTRDSFRDLVLGEHLVYLCSTSALGRPTPIKLLVNNFLFLVSQSLATNGAGWNWLLHTLRNRVEEQVLMFVVARVTTINLLRHVSLSPLKLIKKCEVGF